MQDDAQAQERLQMLQEEAIASGKQNAAIEMRWAELLELNMPQQLYTEIESQKKSCAEIITSKDNLIREFKKQLKIKDEEYVKSLKRYGEDVEELLKRMRKEIRELQQHYEVRQAVEVWWGGTVALSADRDMAWYDLLAIDDQVEMDAIETAFLMERDEALKNNRGEIEGLLEKRRQKELTYMRTKQEREEEYQKEIEDLLVQVGGCGGRVVMKEGTGRLMCLLAYGGGAGGGGVQQVEDQAGDRDPNQRAAARGDARHVPAQHGEARVQLPRADGARHGEHGDAGAPEEEAVEAQGLAQHAHDQVPRAGRTRPEAE